MAGYSGRMTPKKVKKTVQVVNTIAVLLMIWIFTSLLFFDTADSYSIAVFSGLLFPAIPFFVLAKYGEFITILKDKNSIEPSIGTALFGPPLVLLIRASEDYDLVTYYLCIIPGCAVFALICFVFYKVLSRNGPDSGKYNFILAAIFMLPYCYSSVVIINCKYDNSPAQNFSGTVLNKYKTNTKSSHSYYIVLQGWGPMPGGSEIKVSPSVYDVIEKGASINLTLKSGLIGIPWYYIKQY